MQKEAAMLMDGGIKKAVLLTAVDVCLRRMKNSPKRCARNLVELGSSAYPDKISGKEESELYQQLLASFEIGDVAKARALFTSVFL